MSYNRINWENGEASQSGYVEINGVRYPLVMPEYTGATPIDATNLNIMDKGIKDLDDKIDNLSTVAEEINIQFNNTYFTEVENLPIKMYRYGKVINICGAVNRKNDSSSGALNIFTYPNNYSPISYPGLMTALYAYDTGDYRLAPVDVYGGRVNLEALTPEFARNKNIYFNLTWICE